MPWRLPWSLGTNRMRVDYLAEQVPSIENGLWTVNDDGTMVTTFHLRQGALWHDGNPITVDDFLFSLRVGREGAVPGFNAPIYAAIADARAADPQTLVVRWKE